MPTSAQRLRQQSTWLLISGCEFGLCTGSRDYLKIKSLPKKSDYTGNFKEKPQFWKAKISAQSAINQDITKAEVQNNPVGWKTYNSLKKIWIKGKFKTIMAEYLEKHRWRKEQYASKLLKQRQTCT